MYTTTPHLLIADGVCRRANELIAEGKYIVTIQLFGFRYGWGGQIGIRAIFPAIADIRPVVTCTSIVYRARKASDPLQGEIIFMFNETSGGTMQSRAKVVMDWASRSLENVRVHEPTSSLVSMCVDSYTPAVGRLLRQYVDATFSVLFMSTGEMKQGLKRRLLVTGSTKRSSGSKSRSRKSAKS
jgi:hypothetical protein